MVTFQRIALLPAILLAACAQAPHHAFDAAGRDAVRSTDVVAVVPQTELNAEIVVSTGGGAAAAQFGLLGALVGAAVDAGINASRASTAEEAVRPLRDVLLGFDFDGQLRQELERELATLDWLKAAAPRVSKQGDDTGRLALLNTQASGVLVVDTRYALSPDFSTLRITTQTALMPPAAAAPAPARKSRQRQQAPQFDRSQALYRNQIVVEATLDTRGTLEENRLKWSEGGLVHRSLQAQIAETARLIAQDLQYQAPAADASKAESLAAVGPAAPQRLQDGTLKSAIALAQLPGPTPIAVAAPAEAPAAPAAIAAPAAANPGDATPTAAPATTAPAASPAAPAVPST